MQQGFILLELLTALVLLSFSLGVSMNYLFVHHTYHQRLYNDYLRQLELHSNIEKNARKPSASSATRKSVTRSQRSKGGKP